MIWLDKEVLVRIILPTADILLLCRKRRKNNTGHSDCDYYTM